MGITTMVTERTTTMGMELTQRKATTMAVTTTTTMVHLQRRENKRKNKVQAAPLLMAAANKEGTSSKRGYNPSAGLNRAIMSVCPFCIIGNNTTTHWAPVDTTLHSIDA